MQTTNAIAAIRKVVEHPRFHMSDIVTVYVNDLTEISEINEVYTKLMPDPKAARVTVQVAGLTGRAKIEISAIAVKQ